MIDINELRRLAQEATPGPWINHGRQPNVAGLPHSAVAAKTLLARVYSEAYGDVEQETANASFIAAANPATITELLDRLEAAEKSDAESIAMYRKARDERDALRAKIEAMERQEPVATVRINAINGNPSVDFVPGHHYLHHNDRLYLAPGAQPALIEQDTSVRKAWARFSNELHRSPDAPYPGMADAFEQHFSQSFTDREWRTESATWAAAWKAAKRHEAQAQPAPSVPECPYPCGWRNLLKHAIEDGAYLARSINEDEPVTEHARAATMQMVVRLRDVLIAINKVAQEAKP